MKPADAGDPTAAGGHDDASAIADELDRMVRDLRNGNARRLDLPAHGVDALGLHRDHDDARLHLGATIGDYRLVRRLGQGGMGIVFEAEQRHPHRRVALKVLPPHHLDDAFLKKAFQREIETLAGIQHPNVAAVFAAGAEGDMPFFTMELVRGSPLESRSLQRDPTRAVALFYKICAGVAAVHRQGVMHRDLKPGNVLIDEHGEPRIVDFGLARFANREITRTSLLREGGSPIGTPAYMSPEQACGAIERVGAAADVYALGVILFELLTGRHPHPLEEARTTSEMLAIIERRPPKRPRLLRPELPADLEAITLKCLAKDPDERYADAGALLEELDRHLAGKPVAALQRSTAYLLRLVWHRHRAAVAALLSVLLAVGATIAIAYRIVLGQRNLAIVERDHNRTYRDLKWVEWLRQDQHQLWPPRPDRLAEISAWLERGETLMLRLPEYRAQFDALRSIARLQPSPEALAAEQRREWIARLKLRAATASVQGDVIENIDRSRQDLERLITRGTYVLPDADQQDYFETLRELTGAMDGFLQRDPRSNTVAAVQFLKHFAETVVQQTVLDRRDAWRAACTDIAGDERFAGFTLTPQVGLVPLGRDPTSGLQEFAHPLTGRIPTRDASTGRLELTDDTCAVFVLVPGGQFDARWDFRGEIQTSPLGHLYAESALIQPLHARVSPFLIAKYELTTSQYYRRAIWLDPLSYAESRLDDLLNMRNLDRIPLRRSWHEMQSVLPRLGLRFPTEFQWEWAARGGADVRQWWCEDVEDALRHAENLADSAYQRAVSRNTTMPAAWDDGFDMLAPVGSFQPNPFGLFDIHGNVTEGTSDILTPYYYDDSRANDDGVVDGDVARESTGGLGSHIFRGGSYATAPRDATLGIRTGVGDLIIGVDSGVRPVWIMDAFGKAPADALDPPR